MFADRCNVYIIDEATYTRSMKRTQLYFDEEMHEQLIHASIAQHRSAASIVREAVAAYLATSSSPVSDDPIAELVGAFGGLSPDVSETIDDIYKMDIAASTVRQ